MFIYTLLLHCKKHTRLNILALLAGRVHIEQDIDAFPILQLKPDLLNECQ